MIADYSCKGLDWLRLAIIFFLVVPLQLNNVKVTNLFDVRNGTALKIMILNNLVQFG